MSTSEVLDPFPTAGEERDLVRVLGHYGSAIKASYEPDCLRWVPFYGMRTCPRNGRQVLVNSIGGRMWINVRGLPVRVSDWRS